MYILLQDSPVVPVLTVTMQVLCTWSAIRLMLTPPIPTQCEWTASVMCVCLLLFIVFLVTLEDCSLKLRLTVGNNGYCAMRVHQRPIPTVTRYLGSYGLNRRDSNAAPNELGLLRLGFEPTVSCMRCQRFITTSLRNIR